MVQPAVLCGGLEHGVFTADLVGEGGHAELVLHAAHDVQVRHAGLDHHHVGALGQVQRHFAQGFVAVARVHLVDLLVGLAQVGCRAHGVAERAVKGAGVLGAVGHDACVHQALGLQGTADGTDAAVHHVAGRHHVHTGFGLREGLLHQDVHRGVVQDVVVLVQQPVLAVAGERVERHVGHHAQLRELLLQLADHPRHQAVRVHGFFASGVLSDWSITGNSAITGMPSFTQSSATGSSRSRLRRSTPGMEPTASRRCAPSRTNTG
ncbi:hypothetical protein Y695_00717 [Hydrogenophaga sp. T4]|nr:hypothetical protein Y695_00717 [Hydrogenophaga sp. T4]